VFGYGGLAGLGGCVTGPNAGLTSTAAVRLPPLAPVRAQSDRLFDVTVCLRPFRAQGPRLDVEEIGDALVVHNYGHGGSGWSLSWGSGAIAVQKAMARSPKAVAVVGCGALGLTAATLAQRAGARVTIYARDLLPQTRSSRATGSWTPDSRIALSGAVDPSFPALWEQMARTSFKTYRSYLGLPGTPVEWSDRYILSDRSPEERARDRKASDPLGFADYGDRISDLTPGLETLPAAATPFPSAYVQRTEQMQFNVADYGHTLMNDFLISGGSIERREFHDPSELALLNEKVIINCPGYGGQSLWRDETIIPVRGQIGWLIPQPEVNYGLLYKGVNMLSRRDGIVIQAVGGGDMTGYKDDNEAPDRKESEAATALIAELYAKMKAPGERL
jgi:glycine/D-amino acid oxidase-like deaminating enzyme